MQNVIDNYYNFLLYSTMISFITYIIKILKVSQIM